MHQAPRSLRCRRSAFTLIELLVVIAIIAILAGLTLSTLGYVNTKGAESRAQSEIAALSAALESYKIDLGAFPSNNISVLYTELTGRGTVNSNKIYLEPSASITTNVESGPFIDPWGSPYGYSNIGTHFEMWSTAGGKETAEWIRN
jgi:general secretion pathway protein G